MHLIIDGFDGDSEKLRSHDFIHQFLDRYPDFIGMTKITPPQVYSYRGQRPMDWGVSGFVLIAESHISVHTFPDRRYVNVDVFSCKEFDADRALEEVRSIFGFRSVKSWILDRGLDYSTPEEAFREMERERAGLASSSPGERLGL